MVSILNRPVSAIRIQQIMYLTFSSFVDRDMVMRYHWGLAIGHIYSHPHPKEQDRAGPDSIDADSHDINSHVHDDAAQIFIDGVEEFEVESILNSRIRRGNVEYLVHWKGYSHEEDTWEPQGNVENSADLIRQFHRDYPSAPRSADCETGECVESDGVGSDDGDRSVTDESQTTDDLEEDSDDGGSSILELQQMYGSSWDCEVYE
jgi:hypothetical protein